MGAEQLGGLEQVSRGGVTAATSTAGLTHTYAEVLTGDGDPSPRGQTCAGSVTVMKVVRLVSRAGSYAPK